MHSNPATDNGMTPDITDKATALLRRFYGYDTFRPLQLDIISSAVSGRDSVVLMPTGGGKSICYQIPALLSDHGVVIVVSPLIALMKDQEAAQTSNGIPAAAVNSMQTDEENRDILEQLATGRVRLLYISPERLLLEMDRWSRSLPITLFAIDEAHCISMTSVPATRSSRASRRYTPTSRSWPSRPQPTASPART